MNPLTQDDFSKITQQIAPARQRAVQAVNTTLIDLYWQVGQTISRKIEAAEWGDGVVARLAEHLALTQPGLRGFTRPNLFRMRQFYDAYRDDEKVSPLVRQFCIKVYCGGSKIFSSNWGAISVLPAANIRCKWAGGTSRWICCFSIRPRRCCKPSCTNSICRTRRTTIPKTQPEPPNSLLQKYRLSEKSSKLMTPLTTSKRENHVPNSSHSNRPGRLSWQAIHSGYSCASLHRCRQPSRRYVNRGCTTGIRFDSGRYPSCLGVRQ